MSSEEVSFSSDKESDGRERKYGVCDEPSSPRHPSIIHSFSYDVAVRAMKSIFLKVKRCCKSSRVHSSTGEKFPGQCSVVLPPPIFSSCP